MPCRSSVGAGRDHPAPARVDDRRHASDIVLDRYEGVGDEVRVVVRPIAALRSLFHLRPGDLALACGVAALDPAAMNIAIGAPAVDGDAAAENSAATSSQSRRMSGDITHSRTTE